LLTSLVAQVNLLRSLLERVNPGVERGFYRLDCYGALAVLDRYPLGGMLAQARPDRVAQLKANTRRVGKLRADRLVASARSIPGEQGTATDAVVVRQLVAAIRQLQRSLAALETTIAEQVQGNVLFTIEGLGAATVPVILAELPVEQLDTDTKRSLSLASIPGSGSQGASPGRSSYPSVVPPPCAMPSTWPPSRYAITTPCCDSTTFGNWPRASVPRQQSSPA